MALSLTLDRASYLVGDTATATLTGTAADLARAWTLLGGPGGAPLGLQIAKAGPVTWSAGWTQTSRTATTVKATKTLTATGSFTVTATVGATTVSASATVGTTTPPPGGVRKLRGIVPWTSWVGALSGRLDEILAQGWVGGVSGFMRWNGLTPDGVTYKWAGYDNMQRAAAKARKPWALMLILGNKTDGYPTHVISQVPANNWIAADAGEFAVFWSPKANQLMDEVLDKIADRYKDDPWLAQVRVVGLWNKHGEPWFAGGVSSKTKWAAAWRATHPADAGLSDAAALVKVQAAYQVQDKQWWADQAARWPAHISLSAAAGDAMYDVAGAVADHLPDRHPARLATWTDIRAAHGARSVVQFNGVNAGNGASGYGRWLPNSFGPVTPSAANGIVVPAERRGRIGAQPVAGAGTTRLSWAGALTMIDNLTAWGYSYCELYGVDAAAAIDGATPEAIALRNKMIAKKGAWTA